MAANFALVTTGISKCGTPLYTESSTIFGSIKINLTWSGRAFIKILVKIVLIATDLPEPVDPAISRCGILVRLADIVCPVTSLPNGTCIGSLLALEFWCSITSLKETIEVVRLGTSIPINGLPGIGASILISFAASAKAKSSDKLTIRLTFTPTAG